MPKAIPTRGSVALGYLIAYALKIGKSKKIPKRRNATIKLTMMTACVS